MDLTQVQVENITFDDPGWLGSQHGVQATRPIILDASLFVAGTHYPNGYLPSGTVIAKVTATGRYGPYDSSKANGQQTAAGFLYGTTKINSGTATPAGALMWHGAVVGAKLPFGTGSSATTPGAFDAAAQTALAARVYVI